MPNEDNPQENTDKDGGNTQIDDSKTSEELEKEQKKQEREEKKKENEEKEEEFHVHKGKIMGIKPYTQISSVSWDKSYDNPTGTSKATIHHNKYDSDDYSKFIYKGASCKVKIRRSNEEQFKTTGIEEYGLSEDEIKEREHYPTEEQLEEISILKSRADLINSDVNESEREKAEKKADETKPYSRSDNDAGIYGFITDVSNSQKGTELEIKDWGYCLEDKTKELSFSNMNRSFILEEVIKSYGLVPVVDFTGLRDDTISWSNVTKTESSTNESSIAIHPVE